MPTVPQPPQAVRTEKSLSRFRKSRGSFFASGYTSLDGLFRLCRMVIKQARKRDLLTQLLQDGGAGKFKAIAEAHGLTCVLCGQYEWNTMPGGNLVEYALSKGWNEIRIGRSSLPPVLPLRSCGDGPGRGGDVGKGLPCGGTGKPTASAWDKSVTFFFISAASCAFASLASGPLGGGCPLLALPQEAKNAVRGMYIPTQHISLQHSR
jgi:hypothetical protein